MTKEQRAKMNKALDHYIQTERMPGSKEDYLEHIATTTLMNKELIKTFKITQKEIDEKVEEMVNEILETYDGQ